MLPELHGSRGKHKEKPTLVTLCPMGNGAGNMEYSQCMERKRPNILLCLLVLAVGIILSRHAMKHRSHAMVRQCMDDNGPHLIWEDTANNEYLFVCKLKDGKWGIQPLVREEGVLYEKTAFTQTSKMARLIRYLGRNADQILSWKGGTLSDAIQLVLSR